jgi:hypothetical protein
LFGWRFWDYFPSEQLQGTLKCNSIKNEISKNTEAASTANVSSLWAVTLLISITITLVNIILSLIIAFLSYFERHTTMTYLIESWASKQTWALFVNSALITLSCNLKIGKERVWM